MRSGELGSMTAVAWVNARGVSGGSQCGYPRTILRNKLEKAVRNSQEFPIGNQRIAPVDILLSPQNSKVACSVRVHEAVKIFRYYKLSSRRL